MDRIQLPLEDDFVCLRKLRCFAQTEQQGSFGLSEDIISRFKDTYRQEQNDFNKGWSEFRWTKMVELGLSIPSDIGCDWNNYLSSNAHNSTRRIYMAIAPCIDSCHSNGHSHASHSRLRKRRILKHAPSTPSHNLRRGPRIRHPGGSKDLFVTSINASNAQHSQSSTSRQAPVSREIGLILTDWRISIDIGTKTIAKVDGPN